MAKAKQQKTDSQPTTVKFITKYQEFINIAQGIEGQFPLEKICNPQVQENSIVYGSGVSITAVQSVIQGLNYLPLPQKLSQEIPSNQIVINLGNLDFSKNKFSLKINTEEYKNLCTDITDLFGIKSSFNCTNRNHIQYGGASELLIAVLSLHLKQITGSEMQIDKTWGDEDADIWVELFDSSVTNKSLREWVPVEIQCDNQEFFNTVKNRLLQEGFQNIRQYTGEKKIEINQLALYPNTYLDMKANVLTNKTESNPDLDKLYEVVLQELQQNGVEIEKFPFEKQLSNISFGAVINLPVQAIADRSVRPYGKNYPGGFPVKIKTDDLLLAEPFREILEKKGYSVAVEFLPPNTLFFPSISWGEFATHPMAQDLLTSTSDFLQKNRLPQEIKPVVRKSSTKEIVIDLPSPQNFPLVESRLRQAFRSYRVSLNIDERDPRYVEIRDKLRDLGCNKIRPRQGNSPGENIVHFGGIPTSLIAEICKIVEPHMKENMEMEQYWGDDDHDVFIFLPTVENNKTTQPVFDCQKWLAQKKMTAPRSFISTSTGSTKAQSVLQIGNVYLNVAGKFDHVLTPSPDNFVHYCVDAQTAELLQRVAESVVAKEPLLLEGSTATSKTSSILYLASLVGQPVMRLNLSGATDVSEFVGRFIPDENRDGNGWKWEDGPVVKALQEGYWLILDELNLAEPSILERLNSILEKHPSILLSEYNDKQIGGTEHPVHQGFRVFATQNPETYAGRNALSPAYRDRFQETHVSNPNMDATSMESMLTWLIFGEMPTVLVNGTQYSPMPSRRPLAIAQVPSIRKFINSLSIFHASLCVACSTENGAIASIGGDKMGGYTFTRRGLLRMVEFLERHIQPTMTPEEVHHVYRLAIVRCYLERVAPTERNQVVNLLDAAGIGPDTWVIETA